MARERGKSITNYAIEVLLREKWRLFYERNKIMLTANWAGKRELAGINEKNRGLNAAIRILKKHGNYRRLGNKTNRRSA